MVRSYVNNEIEMERFKNYIIKSDKLIDYHNEKIKQIRDTIKYMVK